MSTIVQDAPAGLVESSVQDRNRSSVAGSMQLVSFKLINSLTHKIENVFDAARKNELALNGDVTELVFRGLDHLVALIDRLKEPGGEPVDSTAVQDAIRQMLQTAGVERKQSSQADAERAMCADSSTPATDPQAAGETACVAAPPATPDVGPAGGLDPLDDIRDEAEIPDKYLSIFIDETETSLEGLTSALLALESGAEGDDLKDLMGCAHKIKGSAASIGLNRIAKLAHLMEDLLEELIQSSGSLSAGLIDVLLKCTDALQRHVTAMKQGLPRSDHFGQIARELLAARSQSSPIAALGRETYAGEVTFEPSLPTAGLKAQILHERLAKIGELFACDPSPEKLDGIEHLDSFRFRLTTDQPLEAVKDRLRVAGVLETSVEPLEETPRTRVPAEPAPAEPAAKASDAAITMRAAGPNPTGQEHDPRARDPPQRPTETVRVDIDRLDHLMDLAGQCRPEPGELGAGTADGQRAGKGGLPVAARRPAGLSRRRRNSASSGDHLSDRG